MLSYPPTVAKATRTPMTTDREKTIGVRVTAEEYDLISQKAEAMGLRAASYVRMLALRDAGAEMVESGLQGLSKLMSDPVKAAEIRNALAELERKMQTKS